jgi:YHS domain-containing protein
VFVDRGGGYFEPRRVETGWRIDDRIEVVKGLMPGERIVLSGNFLLDSESRMKMAAMGISQPDSDQVCGMDVDQGKARTAGREILYHGQAYYFCSDECKKRFEAAPATYVQDSARPAPPSASPAIPPRPAAASPTTSGDQAPTTVFPQLPRQRSMAPRTLRPRVLPAAEQPVAPAQKPVEAPEPVQQQIRPEVPLPAVRKASLDPACRIMVDEESAAAAGLTFEYKGKTYFFVSKECKGQFAKEPEKFVK